MWDVNIDVVEGNIINVDCDFLEFEDRVTTKDMFGGEICETVGMMNEAEESLATTIVGAAPA